MRRRSVSAGHLLRCALSFIDSATKKSRRFDKEFSQIGLCGEVVVLQLHRALEFAAHLFGEPDRCHEDGMLGSHAVGASEPEVVIAVVGLERSGLLAGGHCGIPLFFQQVGAREQVPGGCIRRKLLHVSLQRSDRRVSLAGRQQVLRLHATINRTSHRSADEK